MLTLDDVEVEVRDANLVPLATKVAPVTFDFETRWVETSGWVITVPAVDANGMPTIAARALTTPGAGITVRNKRTGKVVVSGPACLTNGGTQVAARRIISTEDGIRSDVVEVTGITDLAQLSYRLAEPDPAAGTTVPGYDVRTAAASTVILEYIRWNAADLARAERQIVGLVADTDPVVGFTVRGEARWHDLLVLCRDLCERGGVTLTVDQAGRTLVATVNEARDLSTEVLLSVEAGTLSDADIDASITEGTTVYVAGQGVGAARNIEVRDNGRNPVRRIERFLDRRDLSTDAQLVSAGDAWLAENGGNISLSFTPNPTEDGAQYGVDYSLGDLVAVDVLNLNTGTQSRRVERVVGFGQSWTADGIDTTITVGDFEPFGEARSVRDIADIRAQLARIQKT